MELSTSKRVVPLTGNAKPLVASALPPSCTKFQQPSVSVLTVLTMQTGWHPLLVTAGGTKAWRSVGLLLNSSTAANDCLHQNKNKITSAGENVWETADLPPHRKRNQRYWAFTCFSHAALGRRDDRPEWLQLALHVLSTPKSRQLTLVPKHGFRSLMLDIPPALWLEMASSVFYWGACHLFAFFRWQFLCALLSSLPLVPLEWQVNEKKLT